MKKFLFILFLLSILTIPVYASAASMTVEIPAKNVLIGDQYHVTVSLEQNPGFASVQVELFYDANVVQCVKVIPGKLVAGMLSATNPRAEGTAISAILSAAGVSNTKQDGTLVTFVFDKPQSGNPNFSFELIELRNEKGEAVACDVTTTNNYGNYEQNDDSVPSNPSGGGSAVTPTPENPSGGGTSSDSPQDTPTVTPPSGGIIPPPWWDPSLQTTPTVPVAPKPTLPSAFQDELMKSVDSFTDVGEDHWANGYIKEAAARGVINGYPDKTFHPEANMTRAEIFTILWNLSDQPLPLRESRFVDVKQNYWFYDAAVWAHENGYTEEGTNTYFLPHEILNREQVIAILYRFTGRPAAEYVLHGYEDAHTISDSALSAMNWAVSTGIIVGMDDTHLAPQGAITRAQITTIIVRYIHYIKARVQ